MAKAGRPSSYTQKLVNEICQLISEGLSLRQVCRRPGIPDFSTVKRWLRQKNRDQFRAQYAQAREDRAHLWAEECIDIADDGSNDWYEREGKNGESITVFDHEHVQRSALRINTRKFFVSKLLPKEFGDLAESEGAPKPKERIVLERGATRKSQREKKEDASGTDG